MKNQVDKKNEKKQIQNDSKQSTKRSIAGGRRRPRLGPSPPRSGPPWAAAWAAVAGGPVRFLLFSCFEMLFDLCCFPTSSNAIRPSLQTISSAFEARQDQFWVKA